MSLTAAVAAISLLTAHQGAAPAKPADSQPVKLSRVFKAGQKATYKFESWLQSDERNHQLDSFLPNNQGYEYTFTTQVEKMLADGICEMRYRRPTMTIIFGENAFRDEVRRAVKTDFNVRLRVSPINDIIDSVDLNPPKKPDPKDKKKKEEEKDPTEGVSVVSVSNPIPYSQEIYRLAAFVGNLDSGLDFAPSMPFGEVKVGETWKKTVGFAPQKLQGAKNRKMAIQRLDMTYRYDGIVESNGKKVVRITSTLNMDSDITEFLSQQFFLTADESPFRKVRLRLKTSVEYDLEPGSLTTLEARGKSEGDYSMELKEVPNQPFQEAKLTGNATLRLVSRS